MRQRSRKSGVWSSRFTGVGFGCMVARAGVGRPSGGKQAGLPSAAGPGRLPAANLMVSADGATPQPPLLSEKKAQHPLAAGFSTAFGSRAGPICTSGPLRRGHGAEAGPSPLRSVLHAPGFVCAVSCVRLDACVRILVCAAAFFYFSPPIRCERPPSSAHGVGDGGRRSSLFRMSGSDVCRAAIRTP